MHLIRDVLDKQVIDRNGARIGKVDGIVLSVADDAPPKVAFIEMGALTLLRRLNHRLYSWVLASLQRTPAPCRITWSKVRDVGVDIEVDIDDQGTPLELWQKWLRQHILRYIPGGRS